LGFFFILFFQDATLNDVPDEFELSEFPTLYFFSADKKKTLFEGGRTVESITNFIEKHKFPPAAKPEMAADTEAVIEEVAKPETETAKDEL
jgi:hypothetical protein